MPESRAIVCSWCHRPTRPVWVHGHGQCEHCRINIEPCCSGDEACPAPAEALLPPQLRPE